ncbi:galactose-3-O-sulfotransferase 2-like [Liolophura sinensis]|uniref:galactose-3-O-sulfotransferase 2-like n=1 Tax=Liolophura sinensis TaxID=3198878 RepID=UPI003158C713
MESKLVPTRSRVRREEKSGLCKGSQGREHNSYYHSTKPEKLPPIPKGKVYEILCQHVVYSQVAFKKYLPPDVAVIAAVREPLDRFVSSFLYFHQYPTSVKQKSRVNGNDIMLMREFLKNPEFYEPAIFKQGSLAVNRMSFDFGIPKSQYSNASFVDKYIKMVDEHMEFVLVADHFDASLVILKRKLCWSTKDILYEVQHKGMKQKPAIPEDIRQSLKNLSPSDFQLYDYFSRKFQRIAQAELNLSEEVSIFQETLKNVTRFCGALSKSGPQFKHFEKTQFSHEFNITKLDCDYLSFKEEAFIKLLWKNQAI